MEAMESSIATTLDKQRNELMVLNLNLNLLTACFAVGGLGTGLFGMNLENGMSTDSGAFIAFAILFAIVLPMTIFIAFNLYVKFKIGKISTKVT